MRRHTKGKDKVKSKNAKVEQKVDLNLKKQQLKEFIKSNVLVRTTRSSSKKPVSRDKKVIVKPKKAAVEVSKSSKKSIEKQKE